MTIVLAAVAYWCVLAVALAGVWCLLCEAPYQHRQRMEAVRRDARARFTAEALAEAQARVDAGLDALPQETVDRICAAIAEAQDAR